MGLTQGRVIEHAVAVFEQALLQDVGPVGRARADDELAVLAAQHLQAGHVGRDHSQHQARRGLAQARHQGGQQQVALEVVGRDGEGGLPARRVELARARKSLQRAEQLARLRRQRLGPRRGDDAAPDLTNSGSPVITRSLSSRWLTADCVTPRRCAAPVMLPTSTTATSSCSKRASRSDQSNLLMGPIMIDVFIFGNADETLRC